MEKMDKSAPLKIKGYEDNCPVCYELWNESAPWVFPCGHMICEKCYLKQRKVNRMCHICRSKYCLKKQKKRNKRRTNRYNDAINSESSGSWTSRGSWSGWNGWDEAMMDFDD